MKKKIFLIISVVMCAVMLFSSCAKVDNKDVKDEGTKEELDLENIKAMLDENDNLVAFVGDVEVTQADFNLMYKLSFDQMSQYSQSYGDGWYNAEIDDDGTTIGDYMKKSTMDAICELVAVSEIAKEKGISIDDNIKSRVEEGLTALRDNFGGEERYRNFIKESRTTDEAVRKYFQRAELYNKLAEILTEKESSEKEMLSEFEQNYRRVQHILISTQEGRSEDDALKIANEVISKLDDGADFDSLIDEYDEDPGMTSGNYYTFPDGQMVIEFENASKELNIGEYTKKPVKTEFGYHIIKKYEVTADCQEFEDFRQQWSQQKMNEAMTKKMESLHVEKKDEFINSYVEEWVKELGVDTTASPTTAPVE